MNYLFQTNIQHINIVNDLKNKFETLKTKTDSLLDEDKDFKQSFDQINKQKSLIQSFNKLGYT